jgi:hypothetical protein
MLDEEKQSLEYWELKNVQDTYFNDGVTEGRMKEKYDMAKALKSENMPIEFIVKITGLTVGEIEAL